MGLIAFLKEKFAKKDKKVDKYQEGLAKSRKNFSSKLNSLSERYKTVNQDYFDELEQILIESDAGIQFTLNVIEEVLNQSKKEHITEPKKINEILVDKMFVGYAEKGDIQNDVVFKKDGPTVLLVVGVNGVGKTTTIAKLAYRYINQGKKVLLVAADTFRAGAVEQLTTWAERLKIGIVTGKPESDPASVAFDGVKKAKEDNIDLVIVDTAGRLQTKNNLMLELGKIKRVMGKEIEGAPHEVWLTIDATTGQNGLSQASQFIEATNITGVILTKMDGTSKGGIVLAIKDQFGLPVRFITYGEDIDSITEFWLEGYLQTVIEEA